MHALDEGKGEAAMEELTAARQVLMTSPAASSPLNGRCGIKEQKRSLGSYQQKLKDGPDSLQRAKKSIQYDNYRTQRGEEK